MEFRVVKSTFFFLQAVAFTSNRYSVKKDRRICSTDFQRIQLGNNKRFKYIISITVQSFLKLKLLLSHEPLVFCSNKYEENYNKPSPYKN